MSNYYILKCVVGDTDYYAEKVTISGPEIAKSRFKGSSLKGKDFVMQLKSNKGNVQNIVANAYNFPILSQVIADIVLQHCPDEVELFEVEIEKKVTQKYYFANILDNLDAFDFQESKYTEIIPGTQVLSAIEKLVLDTSGLKGRNIFRLKAFKTEIIVSETLKNKLDALQLPELKCIATGDFTYTAGQLNRY